MSKKLFALILFLLLTLTACLSQPVQPITMSEVEKDLGIKFDFPLVWLHSSYDYWQAKTVKVKFLTSDQGLKKLLAKFDPKLSIDEVPNLERSWKTLDEEGFTPNKDRPLKWIRFDIEKRINDQNLVIINIFFKQVNHETTVYMLYLID